MKQFMNDPRSSSEGEAIHWSDEDLHLALVEQMDPVIGEASSGIGSLMTELIRRMLRTGIQKVDEELHAQVSDKIEDLLTQRGPQLEEAAALVARRHAESTAVTLLQASTEAIERQTAEAAAKLRAELSEAEKRALANDEALERQAAEAAAKLREELSEAEKRALANDEALRLEVSEAESRAKQSTYQAAEELGREIAATEERVSRAARENLSEKFEELLQRSKGTAATIRESLASLSGRLDASIEQDRHEREMLRQQMQQQFTVYGERIAGQQRLVDRNLTTLHAEITASAERTQAKLLDAINRLQQANERLEQRIVELEKPRGLFAWWHRRKHAKQAAPVADNAASTQP